MRESGWVGLVAALVFTLAFPGPVGAFPQDQQAAQTVDVEQSDQRPNILLITADDMRRSDLPYMPKTRELLERQGVRVSDFISNHPLCCPARAQLLTGQQAHNNGVTGNNAPYGGWQALTDPGNHVGAWLQGSGYQTAFVGKHMNGWPETGDHQEGWSIFDAAVKGSYAPRGMTMFNNGSPRTYPRTYNADVLGRRTVSHLESMSASGSPFFLWASHAVPHTMRIAGEWAPPIPPNRYRDLYSDTLPESLADHSFNETSVGDKPPTMRRAERPALSEVVEFHRQRARSLRALDDQVAAAMQALHDTGELDNTYVFFTSDNGYLLGEHRQMGKNKPYEPALRIPLLVSGPGLPSGVVRQATYGMVDLPATFVELAGATPGRLLDGRSMMPTLRAGDPGYSQYLVQAGAQDRDVPSYVRYLLRAGVPTRQYPKWWWRGVRTGDYVYLRYVDGSEELYDLRTDPHQLRNVSDDPTYAAVKAAYARRLAALRSCAGAACFATPTESSRRSG